MATRRVYISGPIDGLNKAERRAAFKEVQLKLEAAGFETFNPRRMDCQRMLLQVGT